MRDRHVLHSWKKYQATLAAESARCSGMKCSPDSLSIVRLEKAEARFSRFRMNSTHGCKIVGDGPVQLIKLCLMRVSSRADDTLLSRPRQKRSAEASRATYERCMEQATRVREMILRMAEVQRARGKTAA